MLLIQKLYREKKKKKKAHTLVFGTTPRQSLVSTSEAAASDR